MLEKSIFSVYAWYTDAICIVFSKIDKYANKLRKADPDGLVSFLRSKIVAKNKKGNDGRYYSCETRRQPAAV